MPCAKTFSRTKTAFCSTLLYLLFALPLCAQAPPSADTFVSSAYPTTNFGSVNSLAVGPGSTSYVQFNLSGIPAGATVTKASLRLYVDLVSKAGKFDVYQVTKNWSEGSLNFNNQPLPLGGSLTGGAGISITNASCNQFLLIDVTSQVQSWLNSPDTNKGLALALVSGSTGNFFFDAKESLLTANGPELEIALGGSGQQGPKGDTGATGPQGPIGPTGPQGGQGLQGLPGIDGQPGSKGDKGDPGVGFQFKQAFDKTAAYALNDVVSFKGSSYVALGATKAGDPAPDTNATWSLMAQGETGPVGATGPPGPSGTAGVQGAAGPVGPQGPAGTPGAGGSLNGIQEFTSTDIWIAPAGVTHVLAEIWGAGGGGAGGTPGSCDGGGYCSPGNLGQGGGGGGYSRVVLAVTPGATYLILIGNGGVGGSNGVQDPNGASSPGGPGADGAASEILDYSFVSLASAAGGRGGGGTGLGAGGIGGSGPNSVGRNGNRPGVTCVVCGGLPPRGSIEFTQTSNGSGLVIPSQGGSGGASNQNGYDGQKGYILLTY